VKLLLFLALLPLAPALAEPTPKDVEKLMQRDFRPRGQAGMERVVQDGIQRVCTETHNQPPAELAKRLEADQMKTIALPQGSLIGDWKSGERIAQNGRGMQWTDAPGTPNGGSCYNCHQLSPKEISFGTIGPSLAGFGAKRGSGPEVQRYVYGKIYNAKAYSVCSQMPRLGYSGTLTEPQIRDLAGCC
jgi:sulfur-oxidizing protein SoxX